MKGRDSSSLLHPASRTKGFTPFHFPQSTMRKIHFISSFGRVGALFTLIALVAVAFYAAPSSSKRHPRGQMPGTPSSAVSPSTVKTSVGNHAARTNDEQALAFAPVAPNYFPAPAPLAPQLPPVGESIEVFAEDCTTPKTVFDVGDTVCAVENGAPLPFFGFRQRRIQWVAPSGVVQQDNVVSDPQSSSRAVNQVGTWLVRLVRNTGTVTATTRFVVRDPADEKADLVILKFSNQQSAASGDNISFTVRVINNGPDAAQNVVLTDLVPDNTTFVSSTQGSGPDFTCATSGGSTTCTLDTLAAGETANFSFTYQVGSGLQDGTLISTIASISAANELNPSGNTAEAQFTISAVGTPSCTVAAGSDIAQANDPGQPGAVVTYDTPTGSNSTCGTITCTPASGSFFPIGTTAVICSGEAGDSSTFLVTIEDTTAPVIGDCPADITVPEDGTGSAIVNYTTPSATDNTGNGGVTVSCDTSSGESFAVGSHTVTCTATDLAGNTDTCTFSVTVTSEGNDCVLEQPADIVVDSTAGQCGANVTFATPTFTGSCGTVSCNRASGSFFPVGTTPVTCSSSVGPSKTFNVTVNDKTAPVPNVATLPTITRSCVAQLLAPTATDDCGGQISANTVDPTIYTESGTYTVHWTYTDEAGNVTNQEQTVTVLPDDAAPVPDVASLPTVTGECSATVTTVPTATDNCTGEINGTTTDPLTYNTEGTHTITWHFVDANGNDTTQTQEVIVHDVTKPTITAPPDASFQCASQIPSPGDTTGATASDNCGLQPTITVTQTDNGGAGSASSPLVITRTFKATDAGGNFETDTQTVTIIDSTPPTIDAPADAAYQCASNVPAADANDATASDNCGTVVKTVTQTDNGGAGSTGSPLVITRTFTATDAVGNMAFDTQTITVVDNTPPTISCPANIVSTLPLNSSATSMAISYPNPATASDNCSGAVTITYSIASGSVFNVGTTPVTVTATDAVGNSSSCTFTVSVLYDFTGFFSPVSNLPLLNTVNAGRAIPVKFSLSGNKGLNIFAAGYPASGAISCDANAQAVEVQETLTAGSSSLTYSPDQYHYIWKTESSWAGTCRQLVVKLNDGTEHRANFKFR